MEADTSMEEGSEELKRALEWELSLENSDLRSRAWYHGTIPRPRAEELLMDNGDFLIRDCISRPGDYVLTCRWRAAPLHFVINKVIQQPNTVYEKIQFQFEADCFDTVPGLVTYYIGNRNSISAASGAVITKPINRTMPLSYYAARYAKQDLNTYSCGGHEPTDAQSGPPALPIKVNNNNYQTASAAAHQDKGEEPTTDQPPPKPSRISARLDDHLYHEPVFENGRKTSGETRYSFLDGRDEAVALSVDEANEVNDIEEGHTLPDVEPNSRFNTKDFSTALLAAENKPLEAACLLKVRSLLMSAGPKMLANHLTSVDLELLRINGEHDMGLGVQSGLELMLLPHGIQLCVDLLERSNCLKYFVAMLILTCGSETERAQMLHKWIQVAADTKSALGNLYGFTGLMLGMSLPQVARLKSTWLTLRRLYTESALTFETKLRPTLKAMQECANPQAPNTSIPYLFSLATILVKHLEIVTSDTPPIPTENTTLSSTPPHVAQLGLPWERSNADYGLQLLLSHLENGQRNANDNAFHRRNSEIVLEDVKIDEQLKHVFHTEFHLRFLWGHRGALVGGKERHDKLEQVLSVMSERCESE